MAASPADHPTPSLTCDPGLATAPPGAGPDGGPVPLPPGAGRYELLDEIARGGMGTVYRAADRALGREVAVKVLRDAHSPGSGAARRFLDEARIAGQLQHPAIPPVHDLGTLPDGRPFLAMKLIKGRTLDDLLRDRPDPAADRGRFVAVFEQVCQAVAYAHAHHVIHRDLKPANVMVGAFGEVQVMDWGLAKVLTPGRRPAATHPAADETTGTEIRPLRDSDGSETQAGSMLGTPAFMPPEQAVGAVGQVDERADVFGLGAVLAVILTGQPPYVGADAEAVRVLAARGKVGDCLARLDSCGADPGLVALAGRCLSPEPADRPRDAGAVAAEVAGLRQAAEERARRAERDRMAAEVQAGEQAKRRRLTVWAAGAVAAVLLLGIAGTTRGLLRTNDARELAEGRQREAEAERDEKEKARVAEEAAKKKAIDAQVTAEQKRKEAELAREVTTEQRRLALDTVRGVLLRVDDLMKNDARLAPLRIEIIRRMLTDVDRIRDHALRNPLEDRTEAIAYSRLGEIYLRANRVEDAGLWYGKAYAALEKLARDAPDDPNALRNLAMVSHQTANVEWRLGKGTRSRELHIQGLELRRKRLELSRKGGDTQEVTDAWFDIADSLQLVGYDDLRMGDPVSAVEHYTTAEKEFADLPPPYPSFLRTRRIRAEIQVRVADAKSRLGLLDEAEKLYRDSLAEREAMLKLTPRPQSIVAFLKTDVGQGRMYLGDFLLMCRKNRVAAAEYAACLELFAAVLKEEPDNLDLRQRLAATHYRIGMTASDPGQAKEAYAECLKSRQELAKIDPKDAQSGVELALAFARAGNDTEAERLAASLLKQAAQDRQVLFQVACTLSVVSGTTSDRETANRCREQAFQVLRDLKNAGWKDRGGLEFDPDFDAIRDDPRFGELLNALPKPTEIAPPPRPAR